jgi:hypothetical protein
MTRERAAFALVVGIYFVPSTPIQAWGGLGHRLVGLIAAKRLKFRVAKPALVAPNTNIDQRYYDTHIATVDQRLAHAGLRLAAVLNSIIIAPPPAR